MSYMFNYCENLTDISSLSNWNTSNVTNMSGIFNRCSSITDITALADWNTSNVTNMESMFEYCEKLKNIIPLQNWDTSKVENMADMFEYCKNLTDITPLSNWNTSNVTNMSCMFRYCENLTDITALSNWNTSNVTNMRFMFDGCSSIADITALSNWNTSNVTNMSYMFCDCVSLADITALSNWNTSNVTNMNGTEYMFYECTNLKGTILLFTKYIGKRMFYHCNNIDCIIIPNTTKEISTDYPFANVKAILNASDIPTDSSYWGALSCIDINTDSRITKTEIKKATCIENGLTAYTYTWNNGLYTWEKEVVANHDFGEWIIDKEPTDTVVGSKHHICERCNEREDAEINALGHSFGEWIVDREPTDTVAGSKHRICKRCNEREEKEFFNLTYWQNTVNNSYCFTQGTGSNEYLWTSTNKGRNSTTAISEWTINLTHNAEYDLEYSVSSERNYDKLSIFLDETKLLEVSGEENGNKKINLTAGTHTLKAQYSKDSSSYSGDDQAIINLKPVRR